MSNTERDLSPQGLFEINKVDLFEQPEEPKLPQAGLLRSAFSSEAKIGLPEPQVTISPQDQQIEREIIANNTIQVSENLNDAPQGISLQAPKMQGPQSDLCFGIGSILGVTKEALGIEAPENAPEMGSLAPQLGLDPRFNPQFRPSPTGGMGGMGV